MSTFLLNVLPPNRICGDAIAVQDFSEIHVWNFVRGSPPPNQNPGAATVSDESLESLLICAVSEIEPRFIQIIESSEFKVSN